MSGGTGTKFSDHLIDIKHFSRILKVNVWCHSNESSLLKQFYNLISFVKPNLTQIQISYVCSPEFRLINQIATTSVHRNKIENTTFVLCSS